ncbi:hypothetical protein PP178_06965 [Zeaxanthinibacter sp. PT1]|uniref:hypothetical protein n=1 Tax=Zeaxanthinibacter TaxID=561554 RepID=UPI00183BD957|nr:hypothetical protein [Zeaxanthinibacter sp. PT1]MDC6351290.1 hypothetical protein [Zeaxanthinibacter sp. PT1]NNF18939.1 hypothetical protein [Flavobacteriaceae bacterium]
MSYKIKSLLYFVCFLAAIGIYELTEPEPTREDVIADAVKNAEAEELTPEAVVQLEFVQ